MNWEVSEFAFLQRAVGRFFLQNDCSVKRAKIACILEETFCKTRESQTSWYPKTESQRMVLFTPWVLAYC